MAGKPVKPFPTTGATAGLFLFLHPLLDPVFFHVLKVLDHTGMMGDTVNDVDVSEISKPAAGKVIALKTPPHPLFCGALPKTVLALHTGGENVTGETTVAANFFNWKAGLLRDSFQLPRIIYPTGQIVGACPAIEPTYADKLVYITIHNHYPPSLLTKINWVGLGTF
ncbi:MAG: hypothetical protein V1689_00855 [Pseudomonadota bacterium]